MNIGGASANAQPLAFAWGGGVIMGRAPRFDQIDVSINRMTPPRAMGLSVSASPAVALLPTRLKRCMATSVAALRYT